MSPDIKRIMISVEEYVQLKEDSLKLQYLEGAGVDNWQGWDEVNWDQYEEDVKTIRKNAEQ